VKSIIRGIALASVAGASLVLAGCGGANESEADRLQKNLGPVPETTVKGATPTTSEPVTNVQDYGKQRQQELGKTSSEYEAAIKGKKVGK
jgi:hypothetical protein